MRKILRFVLPFYSVPVLIMSSAYSDDLHYNTNTEIDEDTYITPDTLYIDSTMKLINHGTIRTNIVINNGRQLNLKNTGTIDSTFDLKQYATLFHVITNAQELKYINFGDAEHNTIIESTDVLSLSGILKVVEGATEITVRNTKINVDTLPTSFNYNFKMEDNIEFILGDVDGIYEQVLLKNVRGSTIRFKSLNINPLFVNYGYVKNYNLYVGRKRETDYEKVFDNKLGAFLNSVRTSGKNNPLFVHLDSAMDMDSLNSIMQKSVLFNHNVLFEPLRIINSLDMADVNDNQDGVAGNIFGVLSEKFYTYGIDVKLGAYIADRFNVYGGVRVGKMDYQSDFDIFSGEVYGINLGAKYLMNTDSFVRTNLALLMMDTDIDSVLYDDKEIKQPFIMSGYVNADVGYNFNFDTGLVLSPFTGVIAESYSVDKYSDLDIAMRVGADLSFETEFSGIKYIYNVRSVIDTDLDIIASGKIGFWSVLDGLGADISGAISNEFDTVSYKVSLNGRIAF